MSSCSRAAASAPTRRQLSRQSYDRAMPTPVLATKLFVPARRPELVARDRLTEQLDRVRQRLTLISAPAGFGKTTLVSDWIDDASRAAGRASPGSTLDDGDNDPNAS